MAHLSLSLLGPFRVTLDGKPVTDFESTKVRALLAYLAVEADRPHHRDVLAGLLWADWPDRDALSNLRYALSDLRQVIGDRMAEPPFLLITRNTLQFNTTSDHWLDVAAFTDLTEPALSPVLSLQRPEPVEGSKGLAKGLGDLSGLEEAVALYQGCFLEGFSVGDSPAFEEWALYKREEMARQMSSALHRLAAAYEARGDYEQAQAYARRQLELEPWQEEAHRRVMRLLALGGQRGAALVQYETCRRLLAEELDVEPTRETTALYESIRDETFYDREIRIQRDKKNLAVPLSPGPSVSPPSFVGRERELAQLDGYLDVALAGQGRVAFVTGEAGSGKTVLVGEFTRRAMAAHGDLVVAAGRCNAQSGIGDPYLPFREILEMLTGDVEHQRAGGAITGQHARRLWSLLPDAVRALVDDGPDLVDLLLPGAALTLRAEVFAPGGAAWRTRLEELVKRRRASSADQVALHQTDLFEQVTRVLQSLARQHPLVLVLDDLQWADAGSVSLLFHLGRRLAGSRILVVGAYRPAEVAFIHQDPKGFGKPLGSGDRHPLASVVHEFQRDLGDIQVDLDQAGGRPFVGALLDSEPNRLGAAFRETLTRHTGGNPLFTVELLRGLQERGDLVQDEAGRWMAGPALDWERLPARVEAVIAERIGRLPPEWQETLSTASVEGEVFTAEVVARAQGLDEEEVVRRLSGPLSKQHRLVCPQSFERLGKVLSASKGGVLSASKGAQRLSRYRFRHYLFQKYLYSRLDEVEQARLHEAVGKGLEALYEEKAGEVAVQLAYHFEAAGLADRAVDYLLQAGRRAFRLSANEEAIAHFTRGLALLETLPESPERIQRELGLQLALGAPLLAARGWGAPERVRAFARAYELGREIGETTSLLPALQALADSSRAQGEFKKSLDLGEQLLGLARQAQDSTYIAAAHWTLGTSHFYRGEFVLAREYLERANAGYDPQRHRSLGLVYGADVGVVCRAWLAWALWALGYPGQALAWSQEALALAQELDHAPTLAAALTIAGSAFHLLRREVQAAREHTSALLHLAAEKSVPLYEAAEMVHQGYEQVAAATSFGAGSEGADEGGLSELASSRACRGIEGAIAQMRRGLAAMQAMGLVATRARLLLLLAEAYGRTGQADQGLSVLDEALALVEQTTFRASEAELHRLRGELLLMQGAGGAETAAEACFQRAIEVARQQQAKSWELRAAMSLCQLWQRQGKPEEARQLLAEIYGWFTEGFGTPDLKDARELLEELGCS